MGKINMENKILKITISKTSLGNMDYMQIMSEDMVSINIVLIAEKIEIHDARNKKEKK
jgi:hypothetical protein